MPKRLFAAATVSGALFLSATAGVSAPLDEPPSQAYVPGNQALFQTGVEAFDAGDYAKAYAVFSDLADHNDIAALRNIAFMERKGLGAAQNLEAAEKHYEAAARAGLPTAAADLGEMLLYGEAGPADPKAALPWLEMAARANHPMAQFLLGQMYEMGEAVPQDYERAQFLYAAAAAHGLKQALYRLSYLKGWPTPKFEEETTASPPPAQ